MKRAIELFYFQLVELVLDFFHIDRTLLFEFVDFLLQLPDFGFELLKLLRLPLQVSVQLLEIGLRRQRIQSVSPFPALIEVGGFGPASPWGGERNERFRARRGSGRRGCGKSAGIVQIGKAFDHPRAADLKDGGIGYRIDSQLMNDDALMND
jgi:hypothetical protein